MDWLGKYVIAKTAQGHVQSKGVVISYCDAPTVGIRRDDGSHFDWRADLCEVSEPESAFEEWWKTESPPGTFDKEQCRRAFLAGMKKAGME